MNSLQKIVGYTLLGVAGLGSSEGDCCSSANQVQIETIKEPEIPLTNSYFARIPIFSIRGSSTAMVSGDFDGDSDLDLIMGIGDGGYAESRFYAFENRNGEFFPVKKFSPKVGSKAEKE